MTLDATAGVTTPEPTARGCALQREFALHSVGIHDHGQWRILRTMRAASDRKLACFTRYIAMLFPRGRHLGSLRAKAVPEWSRGLTLPPRVAATALRRPRDRTRPRLHAAGAAAATRFPKTCSQLTNWAPGSLVCSTLPADCQTRPKGCTRTSRRPAATLGSAEPTYRTCHCSAVPEIGRHVCNLCICAPSAAGRGR
jgi:hypothetical protein